MFLAGLSVFSFLFRDNILSIEQHYLNTEQEKFISLKGQVESSLNQLFSDVIFLSNLSNSKDILKSETAKQNLTSDFKTLMKSKQYYDKIRFIGVDGYEKIRVNYNYGEINIVPENELQDKSKRGYFKKTIQLNNNEIFTSNVELNIENGKVEIPHKPVIRAAVVVKDSSNVGVIIINYLVSNVLDIIDTEEATLNLLNKNGFNFSDRNKDGAQTSRIINNKEVLTAIKGSNKGIINTKDSIIIFEKIKLRDVFSHRFKSDTKLSLESATEFIVTYSVSNKEMLAIGNNNKWTLNLALLIYLAGFAYLMWYFFKKNTETKSAQEELVATNELLKETQELAKIGSWRLNLTKNKVYWSDEVYRIHELEVAPEIDLTNAINFYHPDYKDLIETAINNAVKDKEGWDIEAKIITAKNNEVWVRAIGYLIIENDQVMEMRGLFLDITDSKNINEKLEKLVVQRTNELELINKRLYSVNKELETFSYSVSHDLKAPLRALQGFSINLVEKYENQLDETAVRWLGFIRSNAERMDNLIRDILLFSKIGRQEVVKKEVDNNIIINEIISSETNYYKKPVSIKKPEKLPNCFADTAMIETVWENILGNAFKYSSRNPTIEITINGEEDEKNVYFSVSDKGVGFDMKYYDKLFGIFQRLHHNEEFEGTGVGLANVKRIIEKHGGDISAYAEVNKGTTIKFSLPKTE